MARTTPTETDSSANIAASPDDSAAEAAFDAESNIQEDVPNMSDLQGVQYVGTADVKILNSEDFNRIGIEGDHAELRWSAENGHFIESKHVSAAQRDWFATQEDFVVV